MACDCLSVSEACSCSVWNTKSPPLCLACGSLEAGRRSGIALCWGGMWEGNSSALGQRADGGLYFFWRPFSICVHLGFPSWKPWNDQGTLGSGSAVEESGEETLPPCGAACLSWTVSSSALCRGATSHHCGQERHQPVQTWSQVPPVPVGLPSCGCFRLFIHLLNDISVASSF